MNIKKVGIFLSLLAILLLALSATQVFAAKPSYHQIALITGPNIPPAGQWNYDISWVDLASRTYYLADSMNARIDMFDIKTNTFKGSIGGFVGYHGNNDTKGPDGILIDNLHQIWAGDGDSTVKVVDTFSHTITASIATGGQFRADEMSYDDADQIIMVSNGAEDTPFISFISAKSHAILGKLSFPDATGGLEGSVWDPGTHAFYLSIPQSAAHPNGEIAVIDPIQQKVKTSYPFANPCHPKGLALGPKENILVGCGDQHPVIINAKNGNVNAIISQIGGSDEVWFNPGDVSYSIAASANPGGPVLGIVSAINQSWLQNIPTANNSHSVAADMLTNHIFVPLTGQGIAVYAKS